MATVKGVWVFNETLVSTSAYQIVSFVSNGKNYKRFTNSSTTLIYDTQTSGVNGKTVYRTSTGWVDGAYRTVDFGETEQTVSDEFFAWLVANAVSETNNEEPSTPSSDTMYAIYGSELTAIADSIRSKTGKTDSLTLEQMVTEIEGIGGGSSVVNRPVFESFVTDEIANHIVSAVYFADIVETSLTEENE